MKYQNWTLLLIYFEQFVRNHDVGIFVFLVPILCTPHMQIFYQDPMNHQVTILINVFISGHNYLFMFLHCFHNLFTFTFMYLADTFIQSDLQCIQAIHVLSVCVFAGNRTHNLLRC